MSEKRDLRKKARKESFAMEEKPSAGMQTLEKEKRRHLQYQQPFPGPKKKKAAARKKMQGRCWQMMKGAR